METFTVVDFVVTMLVLGWIILAITAWVVSIQLYKSMQERSDLIAMIRRTEDRSKLDREYPNRCPYHDVVTKHQHEGQVDPIVLDKTTRCYCYAEDPLPYPPPTPTPPQCQARL